MRPGVMTRLVVLLSCTVVALIARPARAADDRPNVVLIISDDQGWGDFSFMGHDVLRTPHLDALAKESALFPNGYVPTSLCRASLASLMTGLYGTQHKICCNDFPTAKDRAETHPFIKSVPTVPRLLADTGYASLQTGKFWEGHYSNGGFTDGMTEKGRHGDEGLQIGRKTMQPVFDFIDKNAAAHKPFFVWYAPMMPHTPHNPPKRLREKYEAKVDSKPVAAYYAMCEWFDETCGQLVAHLEEKKLRDNTLILFVIDNGWIQDAAEKGKFDPRSKRSPFDAGLRTPILVNWPGKVKPGRREDLVTSLDLPSTILAACGVQPPKTMQGLSLLDVAGGVEKSLPRDAVFGEIFTHDAASLDKPELSMTHRWVRQGDLKLILPQDPQAQPQLFDIEADPREKNDLSAERRDDVNRLRALIEKWWTSIHAAA
jgi:arylsulfatase A-like enzyme